MAAERDPYVLHCLELLAPLGAARSRRMFGGHGLYLDGRMVALIASGQLYLKTDEAARAEFERAGCRPFVYTMPDGRSSTMSYWSAPDEAMESPALMRPWARLALEAALRAAAARRPARPPSAAQPARKRSSQAKAGRATAPRRSG